MNEVFMISAMYLLNNLVQIIETVFFVEQVSKLRARYSVVCGIWIFGMLVIYLITYLFTFSETTQSVLRILLTVFIFMFFIEGKLWKRFSMFLIIFILAQTAEQICLPICREFYDISIVNISENKSLMFVMLLLADALFITYLITAVIWKRKELLLQKNLGKLGIMMLFVVIHIAVILFYYRDPSVHDNVRHQIVQTILQAILFIALVFNYFNSLHTVKLMESEQNLRHLETEMQHNYMYYSLADEKFTEISKLRHDILNQIQTVQQLLKTGGEEQTAREIMQDIEQQLVSTRTVHFCQNPIINAVLTVKMNDVKANKIETDIILENCENLPFENYDICSLFANIYDNAVEACQKLDEGQERFIEMRSGVKNGYFVLKTRNSCTEQHKLKKGEFPKSDKNSDQHGYGTKIIESITKKYNGSFTLNYENGTMNAVVAMKTE